MNAFGKTLVMLHTLLSLLALTWAAAIYLQFTDFGWKEPRENLGLRVPSEFDKRSAAFNHAIDSRNRVYPGIEPAFASMREAQAAFPENSIWYADQLKRLDTAADKIEVKTVKVDRGTVVLDTPGKEIGKPVLEAPIPAIEKSYAFYVKDLEAIQKETQDVTKDTTIWLDKSKDITMRLTGLDEKGKKVKLGLYDLLDKENSNQSQLKFEMEYLEPRWVDAVKEADLYRERRVLLEQALDRLESVIKRRKELE